jgi:hypothetical protein
MGAQLEDFWGSWSNKRCEECKDWQSRNGNDDPENREHDSVRMWNPKTNGIWTICDVIWLKRFFFDRTQYDDVILFEHHGEAKEEVIGTDSQEVIEDSEETEIEFEAEEGGSIKTVRFVNEMERFSTVGRESVSQLTPSTAQNANQPRSTSTTSNRNHGNLSRTTCNEHGCMLNVVPS